MKSSILSAQNVGITFGGLKAVENFTMDIHNNEIVGLIGPNGAGKTTIFNLITGVYQPTEGNILINGITTNNYKPNKIVELGVARTFQNIRLFKELTVVENVAIAFNNRLRISILSSILRTKGFWEEEKKVYEKSMSILKFFDLDNDSSQIAGSLPYGKQRKLEIARAIATNPQIILLDEPAAGMNDTETEQLKNIIKKIKNDLDISIFLIEHDMNLVLGICERLIVLNYGQILAQGNPHEVIKDAEVVKAYLGE